MSVRNSCHLRAMYLVDSSVCKRLQKYIPAVLLLVHGGMKFCCNSIATQIPFLRERDLSASLFFVTGWAVVHSSFQLYI